MKNGIKIFGIIGMMIFMIVLLEHYALAVESTVVVKLQREINASWAKLDTIRTRFEHQLDQIEAQRKHILEEIQSIPPEDRERRLYLAKKYYNLRAQRLKLEAEAIAKQLKIVEDIIMRFRRLGEIIKSEKTSPSNYEKEREQIRKMILGVRTLFNELVSVYPDDPSLEMISYSLANKEASLRERYKHSKSINFKEKLDYFIDCASYMRMVLNFYSTERNRILNGIYEQIVKEIVEGYNKNFRYHPQNIVKTYQELHRDDQIVQGALKESYTEASGGYADLNYPEYGQW